MWAGKWIHINMCFLPSHYTAKTIGSLFINPTQLTAIIYDCALPQLHSRFLPICCNFSLDSNTIQRGNILYLQDKNKSSFHEWEAHKQAYLWYQKLLSIMLNWFYFAQIPVSNTDVTWGIKSTKTYLRQTVWLCNSFSGSRSYKHV